MSETTQELTLAPITPQTPAIKPPEPPKKQPIAIAANGVQLRSLEELYRFSNIVVTSGLAPKSFDTPEKVMIALQMGMELGLSPMQALQSIAVINGRPCVWGDGALGLIQAHPEFEDISETVTGEPGKWVARCELKRRGKTLTVREFSMEDAKRAGLSGKSGPWTQYPERMLKMRARAFALRDAFADALRGIGVSEELQDYHEKPAVAREVVSTLQIQDEE